MSEHVSLAGPRVKQLNIRIPSDLLRDLKVIAAEDDMPLQDVVAAVLRRFVVSSKKKLR